MSDQFTSANDYDGAGRDEGEEFDGGALGSAPVTPASEDGTLERCHAERADLSPKETALCAGLDLAERTENEEDGGS
jgi:hypothetical protein